MRCYLVRGGGRKRYAGTQAEARLIRNTIVEETGVKKKDVTIDEAEIPATKAELIAFINGLCTRSDEGEAE